MEFGILTDSSQPVGTRSTALRDQIDLCGADDVVGQIGVSAMQGLAANDDELLLAGDAAGRTQDVINLLLLHSIGSLRRATAARHKAATDAAGWSAHPVPTERQIARRRPSARDISATRRKRKPRRRWLSIGADFPSYARECAGP